MVTFWAWTLVVHIGVLRSVENYNTCPHVGTKFVALFLTSPAWLLNSHDNCLLGELKWHRRRRLLWTQPQLWFVTGNYIIMHCTSPVQRYAGEFLFFIHRIGNGGASDCGFTFTHGQWTTSGDIVRNIKSTLYICKSYISYTCWDGIWMKRMWFQMACYSPQLQKDVIWNLKLI